MPGCIKCESLVSVAQYVVGGYSVVVGRIPVGVWWVWVAGLVWVWVGGWVDGWLVLVWVGKRANTLPWQW